MHVNSKIAATVCAKPLVATEQTMKLTRDSRREIRIIVHCRAGTCVYFIKFHASLGFKFRPNSMNPRPEH